MKTKRNERVLIDKPYGSVVVKTRDVDVVKDDLEFERFKEECILTYYGPLSDLDAIKVSYNYVDENGEEVKIGKKIEFDNFKKLTPQKINKLKYQATYSIYKKLKVIGINM